MAFSLFAQKGYFGTSISDITNSVGITKSSLYSHYASKDDLFLAVSEDVINAHGILFERLVTASENLDVQARLHYHFAEYILYFYHNPEIQVFSNLSLFHVPPELHKILRSNYLSLEMSYRKNLEFIFLEGMQQGIISHGDPAKLVWSFKTKRDGVAAWLCVSPELTEESIENFWNDFWFGVLRR